MTSQNMGVTETTAGSFDYVSAMVQRELIKRAVLIHTVWDRSSEVPAGADSLKFTRFDSYAVQDKTENNATEWQALTMAADQLLLNKYKHIPSKLEDIARIQTVPNVAGEMVERMASGMVAQLEADIYAAIKATSASNPDHKVAYASGGVLTLADVRGAAELLDIQEVPDEDRWGSVNPTGKKQLLAIADFYNADKYGDSRQIQNGELGDLFGFRFVKTTAVTAGEACFYHREHVAFAMQLGMLFESQRAPLNELADEYSVSTIYGLKTLRGGAMGVLVNASGS